MRTIVVVLLSLLLLANSVCAQDKSQQRFGDLYEQAAEAETQGDFKTALTCVDQALEIVPNYAYLYFYRAILLSSLEDADGAVASFKKSLELGFDFGEELPEPLAALSENSGYGAVEDLIKKIKTPINNSSVATTIPERDLIPEGIAYDPVDDCFYLSSIHKNKIIKFELNGTFSDFTTEKQDGLRSTLGMKVDAKRRILWVATEVSEARNGIPESELGWSGLYKYDLKTGNLIKKHLLHVEGETHLFNDIANSQMAAYGEDGNLPPLDQLSDVVILSIDLESESD